jgi:hypothetical protein
MTIEKLHKRFEKFCNKGKKSPILTVIYGYTFKMYRPYFFLSLPYHHKKRATLTLIIKKKSLN